MGKNAADKSFNDVKADVTETLEDVKDTATEKVEAGVDRLDNLSVNQKLLVTAGLALVSSVVVQRLIARFRPTVVEETNVYVVPVADVQE